MKTATRRFARIYGAAALKAENNPFFFSLFCLRVFPIQSKI